MLGTVNYTRMENFENRLAGEFAISTESSDGGATCMIAIVDLGGGKLAGQIRCFDDGLAALGAFFLVGGAKVLAGEYKSVDGFAHALRQVGIWES